MEIHYDNFELVVVRLSLLGCVVLAGVPGNIVSVCLNVKSFKRNGVSGIAYLHLAVVDLCLCSLHSSLGIVLESVGYYNLNNDMGSWGPFLTFLARDVGLRLYFLASFVSLIALTFVAVLRTWRVFFPFGQARKGILMSVIVVLDIFIACLTVLLNMPKRYLSKPIGLNSNHTGNISDVLEAQNDTLNDTQNIANVTDDTVRDTTEDTESLSVTKVGEQNFPATVLTWSCMIVVVVITTAYILICVKLKLEYRKLVSKENSQTNLFLGRQLKHLITHFILFGVLILACMPSLISSVIPNKPMALIRLITTTGVLNSAVNPYIYCLLVPAYRRNVIRMLCCKKSHSSDSNTRQSKQNKNSETMTSEVRSGQSKRSKSSTNTQGIDIAKISFITGVNDENRGSDDTQWTGNTATIVSSGVSEENRGSDDTQWTGNNTTFVSFGVNDENRGSDDTQWTSNTTTSVTAGVNDENTGTDDTQWTGNSTTSVNSGVNDENTGTDDTQWTDNTTTIVNSGVSEENRGSDDTQWTGNTTTSVTAGVNDENRDSDD